MSLLWWREQLGEPHRRIARHLCLFADTRGRVTDMEAAAGAYTAWHRVSRRTFYADRARLVEDGLLRQTAGACPGRAARYQMCVPQQLPANLPRSLARALRLLWHPTGAPLDEPAAADSAEVSSGGRQDTPGRGSTRVRGRPTRAQRHALLAGCQTVRYGRIGKVPLDAAYGCGRLHTLPLLREGTPHPDTDRPERRRTSRNHNRFEGISGDEKDEAAVVLDKAGPSWRAQRGPAAGLNGAEHAQLARLVALTLRYHTSVDVLEVLTYGLAGADSLPAVLIWRIQRMLRAARRALAVPADETGLRAAQAAQARAAARAQAAAAADRARPEIEAARAACTQSRTSRRTPTGTPGEHPRHDDQRQDTQPPGADHSASDSPGTADSPAQRAALDELRASPWYQRARRLGRAGR